MLHIQRKKPGFEMHNSDFLDFRNLHSCKQIIFCILFPEIEISINYNKNDANKTQMTLFSRKRGVEIETAISFDTFGGNQANHHLTCERGFYGWILQWLKNMLRL